MGCNRATSIVAARRWLNSLRVRVIWKVVLLSRPVLISSRNKVFLGPTSNSPETVESLCQPSYKAASVVAASASYN